MPTPNADDPLRTTDHPPAPVPESVTTDALLASKQPSNTSSLAGKTTVKYQPKQGESGNGSSATPSEPPSIPGYEIERVLGRGGMGVVYKARHLALKRTVALKMMLAGGHAGPGELARFRAEAEAVARLQHPNIVQIHEVGEAGGHPYCALEFVEGGNLADRIAREPMPAREAARLVEALARAMQLAHSRNVVHRDLKPANVLLASPGRESGEWIPKITDFGLARQLDSDSSETQAGAVMGTPAYMAPEQASGYAHEAGPAADVYALGAILYTCLVARPPFQGKTPVETLDQVRTQEPVPPSRRRAGVSLDLETICLKCLRKEPEKRYTSAAELADDLGRYLRGELILARPVGAVERGWRWCARNPGLALLWCGFGGVLLAGIVVSTLFAVRAETKATEAGIARIQANERAADAITARKEADQNAERARASERLAYDRAYNSDLRLVQQAWEKNQLDFFGELLERQRPERTDGNERRGFEWNYWSQQGKLRVLTFAGHPDVVSWVAFSPDGKVAASGGPGAYDEKRQWALEIWDARTGKGIHSLSGAGRRITGAAFSPDGKRLVTTANETVARIWDVQTGKAILALEGHTGFHIQSVAYSPDGKLIATAGGDFTIRLWDAATGKTQRVLRNPKGLFQVAFSPDSTRLAAAEGDLGAEGDEGAVRVWEVATGKSLMTLTGRTKVIRAVAYSPDGKWIATGGHDGRVRIWDAASGKERRTLEAGGGHCIAFSPDSRRLASASDGAKVWDVESGQHLFTFKGQAGGVTAVAFSHDGTQLASGDGQGKVVVWDTTPAQIAAIPSPKGRVISLALGPDGKTILGGCGDGRVRVWDAATGRDLRTFGPSLPTQATFPLALHPGGRQVVIQSPGVMDVWDPQEGKRLRGLPWVLLQAASYSPDGKHLATALGTGEIRILSSATLETVRTLGRGGGAIAYTPQGDYLALRDDGGVRVWEVATGRLAAQLADSSPLGGAVAFSPDGQAIATSNHLGLILVWEWRKGRPARRLTGHTGWVKGLAYSPDGKRLASASSDRTVKLWDTGAGEEVLTLPGDGIFYCVAFSPSGKRLYAGAEGGVRTWDGAR